MRLQVTNIVVISDTHAGSRLAVCPPDGLPLDEGGRYSPSPLQLKIWAYWQYFWEHFVPTVCDGEPFAVVLNGDAVDGDHHGSVDQISHNLEDQCRFAELLLKPIVERCEGRFYMVRGTEAHVGKSGQNEEGLAKRLGAIPSPEGQYARYELWKDIGGRLIHFAHHIGTTGSQHYESSAVMREIVEAFVESGRWLDRAPDIMVRSHRHRDIEVSIPSANGRTLGLVTPGWQAKTSFAYKIAGGRQTQPQFGGIVIRLHKDVLYARHYVERIERPEAE